MDSTIRGQLVAKRFIDMVLASAVGLLLMPTAIFIAIAVGSTSEGGVIFRQTRIGLRGRPFTLYKFRTMRPTGGIWGSGASAARVTPVGRALRRTSLDELPQVWNVLKGDMAVVGPRPDLPQQVAAYSEHQRRRLEVKPGVTGWAQLAGRNEIPWEERIELDIAYIQDWNLMRDIKVIALTLPLILSGKGTAL